MSLKYVNSVEGGFYWEDATHIQVNASSGSAIISWEGNGVSLGLSRNQVIYYDRFDQMLAVADAGVSGNGVVRFDPLVLDNSTAGCQFVVPSVAWNLMNKGEWDKASNVQRLYVTDGIGGNEPFQQYDIVTGAIINSDQWPNVGVGTTQSGVASTTDGYYTGAAGVAATYGNWIFFESLNVGLHTHGRIRHNGADVDYALMEVDLTTGLATLVEGIPTRYTVSNTPEQAPLFAGDAFDFTEIQFAPDSDSVPSAPKGRLILFSRDTGLAAPADTEYVYLAVYDWNPTGVSGGDPSRVHKRQRTLSRCIVLDGGTSLANGGLGDASGQGTDNYTGSPPVYHPPTNTVRFYSRLDSPSRPYSPGEEETITMAVYSLTPDIFEVTKPTELGEPKTNGRTDFGSTVLGDLNELIAGEPCTFTLQRVSTNEEAVGTGTGSLGATAGEFSLVNAPIDLVFDVKHVTGSISGAWTPRAVGGNTGSGNEVEVNLTNGDLQFFVAGVATDLASGDVITSDYNHFSTPVSPSHTTLLSSTSRSDENGQVFTEVRIPDDDTLDEHWDYLTVTTTN